MHLYRDPHSPFLCTLKRRPHRTRTSSVSPCSESGDQLALGKSLPSHVISSRRWAVLSLQLWIPCYL
ncbi:unnamed protein product [Gulo gulo]|uniref:Uncharacterized protein n=1 Tax=Gulo gulo TaxID=48420 RepID=A0A9X9MCL3_GULGU|nr:unnamed protein product [Gulo gulo]